MGKNRWLSFLLGRSFSSFSLPLTAVDRTTTKWKDEDEEDDDDDNSPTKQEENNRILSTSSLSSSSLPSLSSSSASLSLMSCRHTYQRWRLCSILCLGMFLVGFQVVIETLTIPYLYVLPTTNTTSTQQQQQQLKTQPKTKNETTSSRPSQELYFIGGSFDHCQQYTNRTTTTIRKVHKSNSISPITAAAVAKPQWVASYPGSGAELVRELITGLTSTGSSGDRGVDGGTTPTNRLQTITTTTDASTIKGAKRCQIGHVVTCKTHWPAMDMPTWKYQNPLIPPGVIQSSSSSIPMSSISVSSTKNKKKKKMNTNESIFPSTDVVTTTSNTTTFNTNTIINTTTTTTTPTTSPSSSTTTTSSSYSYLDYYNPLVIVLIRNPRYAIPSWYNQIWEKRTNTTFHSQQAPEQSWKLWSKKKSYPKQSKEENDYLQQHLAQQRRHERQRTLHEDKETQQQQQEKVPSSSMSSSSLMLVSEDEEDLQYNYHKRRTVVEDEIEDNLHYRIQKWYDFMIYWLQSKQYHTQLIIPFEQLTHPETGPYWLGRLRQALKTAGATVTLDGEGSSRSNVPYTTNTNDKNINCLWWNIVYQQKAMKRTTTNRYEPSFTRHQQQLLLQTVKSLMVQVQQQQQLSGRLVIDELLPILQDYLDDITTNLPIEEKVKVKEVSK